MLNLFYCVLDSIKNEFDFRKNEYSEVWGIVLPWVWLCLNFIKLTLYFEIGWALFFWELSKESSSTHSSNITELFLCALKLFILLWVFLLLVALWSLLLKVSISLVVEITSIYIKIWCIENLVLLKFSTS